MFLVGLGLAGLLFGVGSSEVRRFENAAARDIAARLHGSEKVVRVRTKFDPIAIMGGQMKSATITASHFRTDGLPLFTEPQSSKYGRLGELKIVLERFNLTGLAVARLEARLPDCRFDFGLARRSGKIRLTRSGVGTGTVSVAQADLESFVLKRFPALQRFSMELGMDRAKIEGSGRFVAFQADISIEGRLVSPDGNKIELADARVRIGGNEATASVTKTILDFLNPVIDLDRDLRLFGALRVHRIELRDGSLIAHGVAKVPDHPMGTWMGSLGLYLP